MAVPGRMLLLLFGGCMYCCVLHFQGVGRTCNQDKETGRAASEDAEREADM